MGFLSKIIEFIKNYNKLIFLLVFIAVSLLFGYLIIGWFLGPDTTTPPGGASPTGTPSTGFPEPSSGPGQTVEPGGATGLPGDATMPETASPVAQGGLTATTKIESQPILGPTMSSDGNNVQYYNKNDGKFYKANNEGQITEISDKVFHNVENVVWDNNGEKAVLEYPDGANIIYNFSTKKQTTLPKHWEDFDFSPNGNEIVGKSIALDPSNRWLVVASDDGSKTKPVRALGENEDLVISAWSPNKQSVAMYTKGVSFDRQEVFFIGLNQENFKSTIVEGRGFIPLWSPQGDRLLYSVYSSTSNLKPVLWIVDAQGQNIGNNRKSLKIETWANKCTFISNIDIICAVPENLEEGAGLFPELANNTKDRLIKINTQTGSKTIVAIPDGVFNMSNLNLTENGQYLYFSDSLSDNLYTIRLF